MLQLFMRLAAYFALRLSPILVLGLSAGAVTAQTPGNYLVDSNASEVHWRIYKAGAFARFGHNHVVAIVAPTGSVAVAANPADSRFEMNFAVGELSIDEPQLRARYGEDFESEPSHEDIAGTRTNMLTEQVLNGEAFPSISVVGQQLSGLGTDQSIELSISLLGRTVSVTVPVEVTFAGTELRARSEFRLLHEDLGMEPFSVMMGALQVAPEIDFTVDIRAVIQDGGEPAQVL